MDGKPLGWSEPDGLTAGDIRREELLPYGRPFVAGTDSLRAALDCAVLSPTGWAVAVDADGRATGVVSQQTIGEAIRGAHAEGRTDAKAGPVDAKVAKAAR
jgi:osmoprotectant transport system ATP-binding protein